MIKTIPSFLTSLLTLIISSYARDADSLYDTCPSATTTHPKIFFNGLPCKDPSTIAPSDFKSSILNKTGDTDTLYGSSTTMATAAEFPGLNTLALSAARTDLKVDGVVMPHAHPRATEMAFVRTGVIVAGFVDSENRVFQKRLEAGDVFVFPIGLLHFCFNSGFENATVFSVMNSQNPGLATITGTLSFGPDGRDTLMEKLKSKLKLL